jgi:hypothetical protein
VHPDLSGSKAAIFAAGTMLYRIFCGQPPFQNRDSGGVQQDIRDGVFSPPRLMAPGLDPALGLLITEAMAARPALEELRDFLGPVNSKGVDAYIHSPSEAERKKTDLQREGFRRRKELTVKTKRFIRRNIFIIAGSLIAALVFGLSIHSLIRGRADMPTTKGMTPGEVIKTYYGAFETLDHSLMEACVINRAGKDDINMVRNLYITPKVREAYETRLPVRNGDTPLAGVPFGVTDLRVETVDQDEGDGVVSYRVSYVFRFPLPSGAEPENKQPALEPAGKDDGLFQVDSYRDELRLVLHKGTWRIAEIRRANL